MSTTNGSYSSAMAACDVVKLHKPNFTPKLAFILGSGLGPFADEIEDATVIPYYKLPGFHSCSVSGHAGNMLLGYLKDVPVVCFQGRAHIYEGISADPIKTLIRTIKLLGAEMVIITNAAGSLHEDMPAGSLMMLNDHINYQFTNPLIGPNDEEFGPRFVSMDDAYNAEIRAQFQKVAKEQDIKLNEGVYLAISGPCFETHAEIRAFKILGADAVGMSTVPETIIARHCDLKVAAISAITNLGAGITNEKLSHEHTLKGAKLAVGSMIKLLLGFVENYKQART
ncbi:MAG: purine-nucleoside phosphorylase [Gammaproteobacteria bacterium]|nr:purine-nucleoside phosphorylase [Gammaproteobacteria bacterium]